MNHNTTPTEHRDWHQDTPELAFHRAAVNLTRALNNARTLDAVDDPHFTERANIDDSMAPRMIYYASRQFDDAKRAYNDTKNPRPNPHNDQKPTTQEANTE